MNVHEDHQNKVKDIANQIYNYSKSEKNGNLKIFHGGNNSTRPKETGDFIIDISHLDRIIEINEVNGYALVEPNVSMENLIKETLQRRLTPKVVTEFPAITCGGAVNGGNLESSSYKYGQLSDTCIEYEIILGDGEIVYASKEKNTDLFYGVSGSYGTLGIITLLKIELIKSHKYVEVKFYPTISHRETLAVLKEKLKEDNFDYIDGIIFSPSQGVVMTGKQTNENTSPPKTYSKVFDPWFYEHARDMAKNKNVREEFIPITEYLFRYNRGAFWMVEFAFPLIGLPKNKITRFVFNPVSNTKELFEALHTLNVSQNFFIQDFYFPFEEALNCLQYNDETLGIYPLWLCPIKPTKTEQKLSPHYIDSEMLLDIGIYGQNKTYLENPIEFNKKFENFAEKHGGKKMLYAHAYYPENEFWNIYNKEWYEILRKKYHANKIFSNIWEKIHISGRVIGNRWGGFFKFFITNPIRKKLSKFKLISN